MAEDYDIEVAELEAIARRDREAFSRWFARCEIPLKRSLRSFAQTADVEAIVQETAIKLWQDPSKIRPDGGSGFLLRWARVVARNAARNAAKRPANRLDHHASMPPDDEIVAHVLPMSDLFLRTRIQQCLERLPIRQQRGFRARLDNGGSRKDRELAESIDMSFDVFRQTITRGRKALIKCLRSFNIDVMEYVR